MFDTVKLPFRGTQLTWDEIVSMDPYLTLRGWKIEEMAPHYDHILYTH